MTMARAKRVSVRVTAEQVEILTNLVQTHLADAKRVLADCESRPDIPLRDWRDALVATQNLRDILSAATAALRK
jgi:transposase